MYKLIKEMFNNEYLIYLLLIKWSKKIYLLRTKFKKYMGMLIKCLKMNLSISILNINYFNIANISRKLLDHVSTRLHKFLKNTFLKYIE